MPKKKMHISEPRRSHKAKDEKGGWLDSRLSERLMWRKKDKPVARQLDGRIPLTDRGAGERLRPRHGKRSFWRKRRRPVMRHLAATIPEAGIGLRERLRLKQGKWHPWRKKRRPLKQPICESTLGEDRWIGNRPMRQAPPEKKKRR